MAGFFKVLWRINAILAFVALAAALALLVFLCQDRLPLAWLGAPMPQAVAAPPYAPPAYRYDLEKDLLIGADTSAPDFEVFRLVRWPSHRPADTAVAVNLVVADKKAGSTKWLFDGFNRAILDQEPILTGRWYWKEPEADDDIPVEIVVLKVVEADTNGDGKLSLDDRQTLYVMRFPASGPEKLLEADTIWFTTQKNKEYQVGYRENGEGFLATYALPDFTLKSKIAIAGLPK
jgi:hypothetical protein